MMVYTAKIKKRNLLVVLAVLAAILVILIFPTTQKTEARPVLAKIETSEQRADYLEDLGWQIEHTTEKAQNVLIPTEASEAFEQYNELQKKQGFDLQKYAGKIATRYVYKLKNYPDPSDTYSISILVYKNKVIGGDITSSTGQNIYTMQFPQDHSIT